MQILSHRGWWEVAQQKNQAVAFEKEFKFCQNLPLDKPFSQYRGGRD